MLMNKSGWIFAAVMAPLLALLMAGSAHAGTITLKGSDTMVILGQRWAEDFMKTHPGITVQVTGGGSGTGIAALTNGTTDLAMSSRPMSDKEKAAVKTRSKVQPIELAVAKDGITVYVHPSNPITELTMAQLSGIYTGSITNWKEVGGKDEKIVLYGRENSSGTYVYFKEVVMDDEDFAPRTQTLPGTAAVVNAVSKETRSVGYGGAAYAEGVKILKVKKDAASPGVPPNLETIKGGKYPISRDLYFYLRTAPAGDLKVFTDWVLSAQGQADVTRVGYFPIK